MPVVSIIVPTFRRPQYLRQALQSALDQTYTDFEVLVCDNGADETTAGVVSACADSRFRYIPRTENLGIFRNSVLGFTAALGEFVMLLDDDDLLHPHSLEKLVQPLQANPDVGMSFGRMQLIDGDGHLIPELTEDLERSSGRAWYPSGILRPATWVVARGGIHHSAAMMRKDVVKWDAIPEAAGTAYDVFVTLQAVEDNRPVFFVDEDVLSYRVHPGSDTAQRRTPQALAACQILEDATAGGRHGDIQSLERRLAEESFFAGRELLHQGEMQHARRLLRQSLNISFTAVTARLYAATFIPRRVASRLSRSR